MPPKSKTPNTVSDDTGRAARIGWNRQEIGVHIAAWALERKRLASTTGGHPRGNEYPTIVARIDRLQLPRMKSSVFTMPLELNKEIAGKVRSAAEKGHEVMGKFVDILVAVDRQMMKQVQAIEDATTHFERRQRR